MSQKILFITANRLGDAVLSTGLLAWLVEHYPEAQFTIACGPYAADIFRAVPRLERLIILRKKSWNRHWLGLWKECLGTRWDLIIDLRNSAVSRLLRSSNTAIYRRTNGHHKIIDNAAVLKLDPPPSPHIWLDDTSQKRAAEFVSSGEKVLALGPAANWPPKQWPIDYFIALITKLTASDGLLPNAKILIAADEREREQIQPLLDSIPTARRSEVIGESLLTIAACFQRCQLYIGNDSGLMHMAAATGIPTLGLFGPGYENIYGPWGKHCRFVRTTESREELLKRLPTMAARSPNLMGGLSPQMVYEAAADLLRDASMIG